MELIYDFCIADSGPECLNPLKRTPVKEVFMKAIHESIRRILRISHETNSRCSWWLARH